MPKVLITGGAGYIGCHTAKLFARAGWQVTVLDDLSRGHRQAAKFGPLILSSLLDQQQVLSAVETLQPEVVVHFAGLAYVGESFERPADYYRINCAGTLNLLEAMRKCDVRRLIFSSSCATYGLPRSLPMDEMHPQEPINPYGRSKLFCEQFIRDYCMAYGLSSVLLRYFNAAGCDTDEALIERHDPETHAIPLVIRSALTQSHVFNVLGSDFDTPDGSAVRDYVHVLDLADAHVLAAAYLEDRAGCHTFNLGTGIGVSVLQLIEAVERIVGARVNYRITDRRKGDPDALVASFAKAREILGWQAKHSALDEIIASAAWGQRKLLKDAAEWSHET